MSGGKPFINENFLLQSVSAQRLYHDYARDLPIIDYHCHLSPEEVATDHRFRSMTELWLSGDHYKWRAMRANGIGERLCTGDAPDADKFEAWAKTVPFTLRNPLYHWTHLELSFPFGVTDLLLDATTAERIYAHCNERLQEPAFTAQGLMQQFKVELVCTTDDPSDDLRHHIHHANNASSPVRMFPTWRPDAALAIDEPAEYSRWLMRLEAATDSNIDSYEQLLAALERRHTFFHDHGCRLSDHGLTRMVGSPASSQEAAATFAVIRAGEPVTAESADAFRSALLHELALWDHRRGWVQQFHIGAIRDTNTRMLRTVGPNTGFDSIGEGEHVLPLARFLDRLDVTEQLAKTILYNLNPRDNEAFATLIGNFQDGSAAGKIQYGSAWWFLDQLDGMRRQLDALSNMGLLARFVGMLTDSRSFVSYSRHDYFRRLLCDILGSEMERGLLPNESSLIGELVRRVCYENAKTYFPWPSLQ